MKEKEGSFVQKHFYIKQASAACFCWQCVIFSYVPIIGIFVLGSCYFLAKKVFSKTAEFMYILAVKAL